MKKQLLLLFVLCITLSAVAQPYSQPKLPTVKTTFKDGKWGLADKNGKCLVPEILDYVRRFNDREYMLCVEHNKEYFVVDRKGYVVAGSGRTIPTICDQFAIVNNSSAIDCNGKEFFPGKHVTPTQIKHGDSCYYLFKVKDNSKSDYAQLLTIDNRIVNKHIRLAYTFSSGAIAIARHIFPNTSYGLINALGEELIPCQYDDLTFQPFNNIKYYIKLDNTDLFKIYSEELLNQLGVVVTKKDGCYTLYDQCGTQLTQPKEYKNSNIAIKKNFKKVILPHFMRRGYIMQSLQEKINNPNRIGYEEYLAVANKLPTSNKHRKSLSSHIAYLKEHPNVTAYTVAECFTKGKGLYDKNKYQEAIPWLLRAAEGKHTPAYRCLADSYNNSKQFQKAHNWYKKCVKDLTPGSNDYWFACMILGGMYKSGRGCEKNYDTALYYLRLFHQNTTQINKSTASEMIAEVVALKNKATAKPQQSTSRSSSTSSSTSRYSKHSPMPNTLPDDANRYICFKNKSGLISSIRSYFYNGEWKATVFFQVSRSDSHLYGFTRQYVDNTKWVYKGGYPLAYTQEERTNVTLHIALNWSYIKINGHLFDIPISKQEYDNLMPRSTVYMNNGGGYNNSSSGSYNNNSNDSGRSYIDGPCKYCGGGGGCSSCKGRGYKYNPYSGHDDTCPSCNGSGRCFNCRGTGKQATY